MVKENYDRNKKYMVFVGETIFIPMTLDQIEQYCDRIDRKVSEKVQNAANYVDLNKLAVKNQTK